MTMRFSKDQYKAVSEIFGNISSAWFTAGVISPLFVKPETGLKLAVFLVGGVLLSVVFASLSAGILKGVGK